VNPLDFPLLADENIDPEVVTTLQDRNRDVQTAKEIGLGGATDRDVLRAAHHFGRVVVTHDADFGTLAIRDGEPFLGIVHLRPGHISAPIVLGMLDTVAAMALDLEPPFVIVADRRGSEVRVRVRRMG